MFSGITRKLLGFAVMMALIVTGFAATTTPTPVDAAPAENYKDVQYFIYNPCNGHLLLFSATAHVKYDSGKYHLSFSNSKAVDNVNGVKYVASYGYVSRDDSLNINLRLVANGAGLEYQEHDQFAWDPATGILTRYVVSQTCK